MPLPNRIWVGPANRDGLRTWILYEIGGLRSAIERTGQEDSYRLAEAAARRALRRSERA